MTASRTAVFLINLVQDVNILRPLVVIAARDFRLDCLLLVSERFAGRDLFGQWQNELDEIASTTGARIHHFADDWDAHRQLDGQGIIFAASESHLQNHVTTHSVFRHAPPGYVRVTLQHGFECVGFRHSADHVRAHGPTASFGGDYVCAWSGAEKLPSMAPSQVPKLLATGPTAVLQLPSRPLARTSRPTMGLVCENLHSVRLNIAGDFKSEFVDAFSDFCKRLGQEGMDVALRPHPGGQYVLKNKLPLPPNAVIENAPIYRTDLRQFAYGISAPSSVLVDMLLAGIPTAVWRDRRGDMDADTYAGLTTISTPGEWLDFGRAAVSDPEPFLELQSEFLEKQEMILEPDTVYSRFADLFQMVCRAEVRSGVSAPEQERILLVARGRIPTLQLSFEKPLASLVGRGEVSMTLLGEDDLPRAADGSGGDTCEDWITSYLDTLSPSAIIFCRYSGPGSDAIVAWARRNSVPVIYHIDDDLLAIPPVLGERKHAFHNAPKRLDVVRTLLGSADLVYASTDRLTRRLEEYLPGLPIVTGDIYCSGTVLRPPRPGRARRIGYMASADHAHNLSQVIPALEELLERHSDVELQFFGSIPIPPPLERFADRITKAPPISDYSTFLTQFAQYDWDIGICPLSHIDFNLMKANTKWVEYTSVGAAVVASRGTVYDECCAGGCGLLASEPAEWLKALEMLLENSEERVTMVKRAQEKLQSEYSLGCLREQVLEVLRIARCRAAGRTGA